MEGDEGEGRGGCVGGGREKMKCLKIKSHLLLQFSIFQYLGFF